MVERVLNEQQQKAVEHGLGPLLIIAGAGTGKTTVVTERISYLIESGQAKPSEILALTFTEKASREMEERVDRRMPYGVTQMWISTFHSFCDRVLRAEGLAIGLDPGYSLMNDAETIQLFRKHLFRFSLKYFRPLGNPTKFITGMIGHFSRLKDEDISPSEYRAWVKKQKAKASDVEKKEEIEKYQELAAAYQTYEEVKVKEGVADYGDLISNTIKLFRIRPSILLRYQEQFRFILIDEFQDTNFVQNELAELLAAKHHNITVVGDDDQAIYRWRGAAVSNIIQFRARHPETDIVVLTQNYRSTKEILDCSYDLITNNNPDRLEVVENIDKKLTSARRVNGSSVSLCLADRVEDEAEYVGKEIKRLVGKKLTGARSTLTWKDIVVLVRANNHAEPFVRTFVRLDIPFQFLGPGQLFRQREVKDLIAYLKVLVNYEDNVAMYRVLTMDWLSIASRDVATVVLMAKKNSLSLFEACERIAGLAEGSIDLPDSRMHDGLSATSISSEGKEKLQRVVAMIHTHLGKIKHDSAGQILYYFLEESGILSGLAKVSSMADEKHAANIAKFFNKLKTYEVEHEDASVFTVVDWIDLSMNLGESPIASDIDWSLNDAVNILTVHSAKGLEFPVVFMVNLVAARFPTTERKEQIPIPDPLIKEILPIGDYHTQEERRLFYVGMTRARDLLYFTGAKYYGEAKREKKFSPFIGEALGMEAFGHAYRPEREEGAQLSLLEWAKPIPINETPQAVAPTFLSYSQISTFLTCPLQFKYRYILKIPVPPSAALSFGDTIHRVLKEFYDQIKSGKKNTKDGLLSLYKKIWSPVGYGNKEYVRKMFEHGKELLGEFFDHGYDAHVIPAHIEESFKISITPMLKLGGKIDRLDKHSDGTAEIIDYKTGQAPKTKNPADDLQLSVYALAATDPGIYALSPDRVTVSFYFLEGNIKVSAKRTDEQLKGARARIKTTAQDIAKSDFHPTPGKHCDFCEFRLICEAWQ